MDVPALSYMGFSHWSWIRGLFHVNWFGLHLYWARGNNLESILLMSPVAELPDPVSFFRLQKCSLQLPLIVQKCRPLTPQDAGMIWLVGVGMGYPFICLRSPDPTMALTSGKFGGKFLE
jgi:hypothetical protein